MAIKGNIGGFQYTITTDADKKKKQQAAETTKRVADANALAAAQAAAAAQTAQAKANAQKTTTTAPKTNATNSTAVQQQHLQNKINAGIVAAPTVTQQAINNVTPATTTKSTYTSGSNQPNATQSYNTPTAGIVDLPTAPVQSAPANNNKKDDSKSEPPTTYVDTTPTVTYTAPSSSSGSSSSGYSSSGYSYSGSSYSPSYVAPARAEFKPSDAYYQAMAETERLLEQLKGGRTSYTDKINATLKGIEDTPAFTYDFNTDPLFQSALASAMRSGQSAMQNTMGQAAALTGGYGNTYGQLVGNQAYNQYIQGAYDNLPDYYTLARNSYDADLANQYNLLNQYRYGDETEYDRMYNDWKNQYTMANDQYSKEFENYWKEQGFNEDSRRWATEFNDAQNKFLESIRQYDNDFNFRRERADVDDAHWDKTFDYNAYRDSVADTHWDKNFNYNAYRDSVGDSQWQKNYDLNVYKAENPSSSGTTSYKAWSSTPEKIMDSAARQYGYGDEFFDSIADLSDSYGNDAVNRYVDTLKSKTYVGDEGKIYNYFNEPQLTSVVGGGFTAQKNGVGAPLNQFATFVLTSGNLDKPDSAKFKCVETEETNIPFGQLVAWYGDNALNHIVKG